MESKSKSTRKLLALLLGLAALASALSGCTRIGPGHVGIVVNMAGSQRGVSDFPPTTGWVWYVPGKTEVLEYPTFMQTAVWVESKEEGNPKDESITFTTKDSMKVSIDTNLSYTLQADKVPHFYVKFRSDDLNLFTHGFLRSVARDCFNEVAGRYAIEQIMGDNAPFINDARTCLQTRVEPLGVNIEQFGLVGAPRPPEAVMQAINLKVQAQQIALQKQNEVLQVEADARKQVARADGEAKAKVAIATGEAQANKLLAESLTPSLLEWRRLNIQEQAVNRWNGQRPQVEGAGSGLLLQIGPK